MTFAKWIFSALLVVAMTGCATNKGTTPDEKRAAVRDMRSEVLAELYKEKPSARQEIASAPGYAVFSNVGVNVIFAAVGTGYGIAHDNRSGRDTYMKMGEAGLGLGIGVKDFRAVFVFHNAEAFNNFVEKGWVVGGDVDAAAKADDKGAAVSAEGVFNSATVYQFTESGLAIQASVKGTKYWVDKGLN